MTLLRRSAPQKGITYSRIREGKQYAGLNQKVCLSYEETGNLKGI